MTTNTPLSDVMQTRAQQLCAAHHLDFGSVFCQQFRITPTEVVPLPSLHQVTVGKWRIGVGSDLPFCAAQARDGSDVVLLGIAVAQDGNIVDEARLSQLKDATTTIDYLNDCAGRFAFFIVTAALARFYGDPLGNLGAVYDPQRGIVASTLNLVLTRPMEANDDYPLAELASRSEARFAFGHTSDKYIKRVLPNHYLDLSDFKQYRFWPLDGNLIDARFHDEAGILENISTRLTQVIAALAQRFEGTKLPLSGGLDSRVLLACAKPSLDKIDIFSHAENMMSRRDTRIAGQLAAIVGKQIDIYDPSINEAHQINDAADLSTLSDAFHIATGEGALGTLVPKIRLEVLGAPPSGGLILRGNGVDFLKAVLWRRGVAEYAEKTPHNQKTGLRMMMLSGAETLQSLDRLSKKALKAAYWHWYRDLRGIARDRAYDLMFAEQFLSHGAGNMFYGFTRNFYICPFNDRRLLAAAISLSPEKRAALRFTQAIIHSQAPEFEGTRYTRKGTNSKLAAQAADDPEWFKQPYR